MNTRTSILFVLAAAIGMITAIVGVIMLAGPPLETAFLPVLTDVRFVVVSRGQDRMAVDWTGARGREHCQYHSAAALVYRGAEWHAAILSKSGDTTDAPLVGSTRPAGYQRLTRLDIIPDGSALRMTLRHRCHPLWLTVTHLPAVKL